MADTASAAEAPVVSMVRSGMLLGTANVVATACGYGVTLVLSRSLGTEEFGALGALLAVGLIGTIPAGALQVVCARWTARSCRRAVRQAGADGARRRGRPRLAVDLDGAGSADRRDFSTCLAPYPSSCWDQRC